MELTSPSGDADAVPLCVDLDGTLIAGDTLWESLLILLRRRPLDAARTPLWAIHGPAVFKRHVARRVQLDPAALAYRDPVLAFLRQEKAAGRRLILATAADRSIAEGVADHLGLFDEVIATDAGVNAKGEAKLAAIRQRLGEGAFDYMGDADCDWPICDAARRVYLVDPGAGLHDRSRQRGTLEGVFHVQEGGAIGRLGQALLALRPHQWAKNLLLAVPMVVGQRLDEPALWVSLIAAITWFSLCASSVYVANDLMDLAADRRHPRKKRRPLASGAVSIPQGLAMAGVVLAAGLVGALATLPAAFLGVLLVYVGISAGYSWRLKHTPMLDVIVLAGLYTLRIVAGGAAVGIVPSFWLLAFSVFIFLSLAFGKRYSELRLLRAADPDTLGTRGYQADDLPLLGTLGPASGYIAVLVFCLYIASDAVTVLYARPGTLWLMCPLLLYWISRFWLISHRGRMRDDPVFFALTDWPTYVVAALGLVILLAAN